MLRGADPACLRHGPQLAPDGADPAGFARRPAEGPAAPCRIGGAGVGARWGKAVRGPAHGSA
eukprot:14547814-Alexandrium_andersonii.AAC.1